MHRVQSPRLVTSEDKQMRLPWWGVLSIVFGTAVLGLLFVSFGRFDLARPSLISIAVIALAIMMRWKLRKHGWFWITMALFTALHLSLIVLIPWTIRWLPAIVIIPIGMADLYVMLWVLLLVGKLMQRPTTAAT